MVSVHFDDVRGRHLLIALSGGADSVALTLLLKAAAEDCDLKLTAAHLNHMIRGAAADADAAYCRELCDRLGIPLLYEAIDVPSLSCHRGLESVAREIRHDFLRRCMLQCNADYIALAHHMNDQAETVLMHLLRGAGTDGVCGMRRLNGVLYRPLLDVPKSDLTAYLRERDVPWCEDATNAETDTVRNVLRLEVIPNLEICYPGAVRAIARFAAHAQTDRDCLDAETEKFLARCRDTGAYGCRIRTDGVPYEAILRRAIRNIVGRDLDAAKLDELIALCNKKRGRTEVSSTLLAEKTPSALYFLPRPCKVFPAVPFNPGGTTLLDGICRIEASEGGRIVPNDPTDETLDASVLEGAFLRTRRDGDHFHPLGAPGDRLLSDYLTDRHIDRPLRDVLPLLAVGNRVLWVCGIGIAEEAKVTNNTRRTLRLKLYNIKNESEDRLHGKGYC